MTNKPSSDGGDVARAPRPPPREYTLADALKEAVRAGETERAWETWRVMGKGTFSAACVSVFLDLCFRTTPSTNDAIDRACDMLQHTRDRGLFGSEEVEQLAYNELLWHCNERGAQGDMPATLRVLDRMVRHVCARSEPPARLPTYIQQHETRARQIFTS